MKKILLVFGTVLSAMVVVDVESAFVDLFDRSEKSNTPKTEDKAGAVKTEYKVFGTILNCRKEELTFYDGDGNAIATVKESDIYLKINKTLESLKPTMFIRKGETYLQFLGINHSTSWEEKTKRILCPGY